MEKTNKGSGWGGPRPGAGRPKGTGKPWQDPEQLREVVSVRLPRFIVEWLKSQPEPQTKLIEDAIIRTYKLKRSEG